MRHRAGHTSHGPLTRFAWPAPLQAFALAVLSLAVFAEPFLLLVESRERNGYVHVGFAEEIAATGVLYPGHFLYHVLTVATHVSFPLSWLQAHFIVVIGSRVLLGIVLWHLVRRSLHAGRSANDALAA